MIALQADTNVCVGISDCNTTLTFLHSVHLFIVETLLLSNETKMSKCKEGSLWYHDGVRCGHQLICLKQLTHTSFIFICDLHNGDFVNGKTKHVSSENVPHKYMHL